MAESESTPPTSTQRQPLKVRIRYCGGWGYFVRFMRVSQAIEDEFGMDNVIIEGKADSGRTGNFDVYIGEAEEPVHRGNEDGLVNTDEKLKRIFDACRVVIEGDS